MTKFTEIQNGPIKTDGSKKRMRSLKAGESIPQHAPSRYCYGRYVNLRWKIAPNEYVEVREHRVRDGRVVAGICHHKNHNKSDNRAENIQIVGTTAEHLKLHRVIDRTKAIELYASGFTTTEIAKELNTHCGNISRMLKESGVEMRFGKGKPANNFVQLDEERIAESLKRNNWNVLAVERETGITRQLIRRVQRDLDLPRIKGQPRHKKLETCENCGRTEWIARHHRCNACAVWLTRYGSDRPKNKPFRKRFGNLASRAMGLLADKGEWNQIKTKLEK